MPTRLWGVTLVLFLSLGCGAKIPPTLTPTQQQSVRDAQVIERVGAVSEVAGYLLTAMSATAATLHTAGLLSSEQAVQVQTALLAITKNFRRRVDDLRVRTQAGLRPSLTAVLIELRTDVQDLLTRLEAIPDAGARADLRALALTLRVSLLALDLVSMGVVDVSGWGLPTPDASPLPAERR